MPGLALVSIVRKEDKQPAIDRKSVSLRCGWRFPVCAQDTQRLRPAFESTLASGYEQRGLMAGGVSLFRPDTRTYDARLAQAAGVSPGARARF